jgi:hypothetical protein
MDIDDLHEAKDKAHTKLKSLLAGPHSHHDPVAPVVSAPVPIDSVEDAPQNSPAADQPADSPPPRTPSRSSSSAAPESRRSTEEYLAPFDEEPVETEPTAPEYDKFWEVDGAFSEEGFANNFLSERKWTDIGWSIAFYINVVISIVLFFFTQPWNSDDFEGDGDNISYLNMFFIGVFSIAIAAGLCLLSYVMIFFFPRVYIKFAMIFGIVLLLGTMIPLAVVFSPFILLFSGFIFILGLVFWCGVCGKLEFSADVLQASTIILRRYPTIFFFNSFMFIVQSGFSFLFSCGSILIFARSRSYGVYVYVILSYFWIQSTLNFVTYQTCAGVSAAWYFLNGTEYLPKHPIIFSLKNTLTTGFGPVALAGFLEGIEAAFEWIEDKGETLTCGLGCCCFSCFKVVCKCCLMGTSLIIGAVNRYSLIYCAMFGVPAKEGVKRWTKVSKKDLIDMIVNQTVIDRTFRFYSYCSGAVGGAIGGLIAKFLWDRGSAEFGFMFAFATACAGSGLFLIGNPLKVISDTLFVGFAEAPTRLETGANQIYGLFKGKAKDLLDEEIDRAKNPEKYENEKKCCFLLFWK